LLTIFVPVGANHSSITAGDGVSASSAESTAVDSM